MAKVILESTDTSAFIAASDATIYGSTSLTDNVKILDGVKIITDAAIERIELSRASTAYTYVETGTGIDVMYGTVKVTNLTNNQLVAFTDGASKVTVNANTFVTSLGGKPVAGTVTGSTLAPGVTDGTASTGTGPVGTISGPGTDDASGSNKTFTIVAGTYEHTITGFGPGDVLAFPAGNAPGINNSSFTDGLVDLTWSAAGSTVTIHLTGISTVSSTTTVNDALLNYVASFNATVLSGGFGAGTII